MFVYIACNVGILSAVCVCVLVFVCVRVCVLFSSYSATRSRRSPTTEPLEQDAANERYWREGAGLSVTPWVRERRMNFPYK